MRYIKVVEFRRWLKYSHLQRFCLIFLNFFYQLLKPSRVPYEESSVYSNINFEQPDLITSEDLTNLQHRHKAHTFPVRGGGEAFLLAHKDYTTDG
jgi:hypothetical protein